MDRALVLGSIHRSARYDSNLDTNLILHRKTVLFTNALRYIFPWARFFNVKRILLAILVLLIGALLFAVSLAFWQPEWVRREALNQLTTRVDASTSFHLEAGSVRWNILRGFS